MNERRALATGVILLFILLTVAAFEKGRHLLDFYFFQLESSLYYILIFFIALGAFLSFLFLGFTPFRGRAQDRPLSQPPQPLSNPIQSAEVAIELGQDQLARDILHQVPPSDENSWIALKKLADLELENGNVLQAELLYEKALRMTEGPNKALILFALGNLQEQQDLTERAEEYYRQVLNSAPDAREHLMRLRELAIQSGQWEKALLWQDRLAHANGLDSDPEDQELRTGICYEVAKVQFENGEYTSAVARVKDILRSNPSFIPAFLLAGEIHEKMGNSSAALRTWEKGLRTNLHPILLIRIGEYYLWKNQPSRAIEFYQQTIRAHPETAWLEYELARLYLRLEMIDEALVSFQSIGRTQPEWLLNKKALAELYLRTGRMKEAAAKFAVLIETLANRSLSPWQCCACDASYGSYQGCCSDCLEWNTINRNQAGYMESYHAKATAFHLPVRS